MENANIDQFEFGDRNTSDITIRLRNRDDRPEWFRCHSSILKKKSRFFAGRIPDNLSESNSCIEVQCPGSDYDHYVKLLKLLCLSEDSVLDSWESVKSALGVLRASIALHCDAISQSCIQYLEAVPWEEKEEEEIVKIVPSLGSAAMPILARIQPVDLNATKNVFLSAIRFAATIERPYPPLNDDLKTSAREQVEYMLVDDEDTPLVMVDEEVRSEVKMGLEKMFSKFETGLNMLPLEFDQSPESAEQKILQNLTDLEWICNILPKMEMMKDFVSCWVQISDHVLKVVQDEKYCSGLWFVKVKLMELAGKAMEAVGYGSVILPAPTRLQLLKSWLPYLRKVKPILDSRSEDGETFPYKMDTDLCQNIEGAIISLVLALPSNDQAEILADWMKMTEQLKFPDLSEAFEVWCYRSKTAKRRLLEGMNGMGNPTVSL